MSLSSDYLTYNDFSEAEFQQRAAALGSHLFTYQTYPIVEI